MLLIVDGLMTIRRPTVASLLVNELLTMESSERPPNTAFGACMAEWRPYPSNVFPSIWNWKFVSTLALVMLENPISVLSPCDVSEDGAALI